MKIRVVSIISLFVLIAVIGMKIPENKWNDETPIYEVLKEYGEEMPPHIPKEFNAEAVQRGRDLVFEGRTTGPNGKRSKFISKFYACTSCHSPVQEDPNLKFFDPEARLAYAEANSMKFLQGSTFYGIANRESWYNDDYVLKYGALVEPASKSLAEATQLCAKVCSSGRYLEDWELEAILAYFWDNQIKLGDLDLSEKEKQQVLKAKKGDNQEVRDLIKSKYALKSPATFGNTPADHKKGYDLVGDAANGKKVYEFSCQSCHQDGGVSGMILGNDKLTFQKFKRALNKKTDYNLYEIIRHGTYAAEGKPRYMPLYPEERMSNQQVEDLVAYILQQAK